jgi:hypothetical protein
MDIRLEHLSSDASPNYVSFLNQAQRKMLKNSDRDSIHSISSIRSVMSTMSSLWTKLGLSAKSEAKLEKQKLATQEDLRYLYSAFTKVPCLRLSPDYRAPLIAGFEEFPFDSAVPLLAFKNVTVLEISDLDFRSFYGWDRISEQVRSLTLKRAGIEDPTDLLVNIVLDDMDRRRKRSAKGSQSPRFSWAAPSPVLKQAELSRSHSEMLPPTRPLSMGSPEALFSQPKQQPHIRQRSLSPQRPSSSRYGSSQSHSRSGTPVLRRSSGSSSSTDRANTPRGSSSNLLSYGSVPPSKWRSLRQLSLSDNSLTSIPTLSFAPIAATLQYLDLSHNHFTEVPDCLNTLISLRALNLSNCMIDSLHSLTKSPLPAITVLNLRGNRLSSIAGIERLLSLERVDLRENRIADPTEMARLTGIPGMSALYVNRNPFTKTHANYRVTIFNLFRSTPGYSEDITIDQQTPSYSERKQFVDRAPESLNPPVVKLPVVEPAIYTRPLSTGDILYDPFNDRMEIPGLFRKKSEHGRGSGRKKRSTRRRVVPIVQEGVVSGHESESYQPKESLTSIATEDSTYGGSIDTTPLRDGLENSKKEELESSPITEETRSQISEITVKAQMTLEPELEQEHEPQPETKPKRILEVEAEPTDSKIVDSPVESPGEREADDLFKSQMDELRNDLGNAWLSALADKSPSTAGFGSPLLSPPSGPLRTASQPIVSTGRTLG